MDAHTFGMRPLGLLLTSLKKKMFGKSEHWPHRGEEIFIDLSIGYLKSDDWCLTWSLFSCTGVKGAKHQEKTNEHSMFHVLDLNCKFT